MPATPSNPPISLILAAGKGTRMKGDLPKVIHEVGGRPMVCPIVDACLAAGCSRVIAIVGYKQDLVRNALKSYPQVEFAVQDQQLGTGHAVLCAREAVLKNTTEGGGADTSIFILGGDGPLIRASTLTQLLNRHRTAHATATLATSIIPDPTGYGRIVRDSASHFQSIVEHKNASPAQREIKEVNPSYYCFRRADLFEALEKVQKNPSSGEYYLTDTLELLLKMGRKVEVFPAVPPEDVLSVNTPEELATVDKIYRSRSGGAGSKDSTHAGARA
jgi:UDP-N-acetylglucosamine diphosphorylase/glucosamine-1-phosphate N-acetyltransferase